MLVALPFELGQWQRGEFRHSGRVDAPVNLTDLATQVVDKLSQRYPFVVRCCAPLALELGDPSGRRPVGLPVADSGVPGLGRALHVRIDNAGRALDHGELTSVDV